MPIMIVPDDEDVVLMLAELGMDGGEYKKQRVVDLCPVCWGIIQSACRGRMSNE